ncbi:hypothetical protein GALMADRAFT_282578 [Galerina marginata CBS 339.88]|uniref:Uncharacterized protein n=1 Tax=Galerina marginata (strain CBS 339.88) TaxID=685588 RepID=A0A067SF93_GALM3|nr:hypothetical protein GALMADRAFT_282578 [Galerina marginata CBS 339.88]
MFKNPHTNAVIFLAGLARREHGHDHEHEHEHEHQHQLKGQASTRHPQQQQQQQHYEHKERQQQQQQCRRGQVGREVTARKSAAAQRRQHGQGYGGAGGGGIGNGVGGRSGLGSLELIPATRNPTSTTATVESAAEHACLFENPESKRQRNLQACEQEHNDHHQHPPYPRRTQKQSNTDGQGTSASLKLKGSALHQSPLRLASGLVSSN